MGGGNVLNLSLTCPSNTLLSLGVDRDVSLPTSLFPESTDCFVSTSFFRNPFYANKKNEGCGPGKSRSHVSKEASNLSATTNYFI